MTIGIEYLIRTKIIREIATFPCSFFVTDSYFRRIVFTIENNQNVFRVKQWNVNSCTPEQGLPPMDEFIISDLEDPRLKVAEARILSFVQQSIPAKHNTTRRPMDYDLYKYYFDNYLNNFDDHRWHKKKWLWDSFLSIYHPELIELGLVIKRNVGMFNFSPASDILRDQEQIVSEKYIKSWRYWNLWKKYMLDFDGIPGEFLFYTNYN